MSTSMDGIYTLKLYRSIKYYETKQKILEEEVIKGEAILKQLELDAVEAQLYLTINGRQLTSCDAPITKKNGRFLPLLPCIREGIADAHRELLDIKNKIEQAKAILEKYK